MLELLNHFPLYHLVIYFLHPELLPSGIRFVVTSNLDSTAVTQHRVEKVSIRYIVCSIIIFFYPLDKDTTNDAGTTYLLLESRPVPVGALFFHLSKFVTEILRKYTIGKVISGFLTGEQKN